MVDYETDLLQRKTFKFDESALYDELTYNGQPYFGYNKLCGLSFDLKGKDSIRFGWRRVQNKKLIELCVYQHINGVIKTDFLCYLPINDWFETNIEVVHNKAKLYVKIHKDGKDYRYDSIEYEINRPKVAIGYYQKLYFGGRVSAPNKITLYEKSQMAK
jgi:hypothetical protein